MGPPTEAAAELMVTDLMIPNSVEWDRQKIQLICPLEERKILSFKPSLLGAPDKQIWLGTDTGEFSTKSGYYAALQCRTQLPEDLHQELNNQFDWNKQVWKLPTAPKVKMFLWKVFKNTLPVGTNLVARNIPVDHICKRCGLPESSTHLLLHCSFAQQVWKILPYGRSIEASGLLDLREDWMSLRNEVVLPPVGLTSQQLTPWIFWHIWLARNNVCFNNKYITPEETATRALAAAREWNLSQTQECFVKKKQSTLVAVAPSGVLIRTDAAWNESLLLAGLGWTITTENRSCKFALYAEFVGSPLVAESLALRAALHKCKDMELRRICCESDSSLLIKALQTNVMSMEIYGIVADINELILAFDSVAFRWISREKNREADMLAKNCLADEQVLYALNVT